MAKEIKAYQSNDGVIHVDKDEADYSDFSGEIAEDVSNFIKVEKTLDKDGHIKKLLIRWELFKHGDFAGWLIDRRKAQPVFAFNEIKSDIKEELISVAVTRKNSAPTIDKPKTHKKKVGVVGLWPGNKTFVESLFKEKFDLTLLSADEDKKIVGLKDFQKVFVLRKFVSHKHVELLRSIGQEPMIINGSMNELKEALSNYASV